MKMDTETDSIVDYTEPTHGNTVEELEDEEEVDYDGYAEWWYSVIILVLAVIGLAINISAIIIMRKKRGIFHAMLKVFIIINIIKVCKLNYSSQVNSRKY